MKKPSNSASGRSRVRVRNSKRALPPQLTKPLEALKVAPHLSDEYNLRRISSRVLEEMAKLEMLREHYGIPAGPSASAQFALALAREYIPGFQERRSRGRPSSWTSAEIMTLAGEMRRELDNGAESKTAAARNIATHDPWKTYLATRKWKRGGVAPDPGEAVRKQYESMDQRFREIGEDAYRYHVHENTLSEWDEHVNLLLKPPASPGK